MALTDNFLGIVEAKVDQNIVDPASPMFSWHRHC